MDGKTNTRWTSAASDPQWLQLDLGSRLNVCKVGLNWAAYASAFSIQVSDDANRWTTLISTAAGSNTLQTVAVFGSGRYIRMYGTARGISSSGYSLNEFQVFTQPSQAPAFTSPVTTTFQVGIPGTFSVTTSGVPAAAISESGSLPAGITFTDNGDGTATVAGTPTGSGNTYPVTLTAADGVSPNATQNLAIQVNQPPAVTLHPVDQTVQPSASVSFMAAASGVPTPTVQWQVSADGGVSFVNVAGATSTTYTFTAGLEQNGNRYRAVFSNGVGSPAASTAATLHVGIVPAFASADHTSFVVSQAGSFAITTTGVPSATLSRTGAQFPAWLSLTDNGDGTGTLTGAPPAGSAGTYQFTLKAANGFSPSASQNFTLFVDDSPVITSADHTTFTAGQAGSFAMTTTAGFPTITAIIKTGSLPSAVTFTDNGDGTATLAGTPTTATGGTYNITISATAVGGLAAPATQSFTLTVLAPPIITSANHATFSEGNAGSFTVTTTAGNPAATTLTTNGYLPPGVTFTDNGDGTATIAGSPAPGSGPVDYPITIAASNGIGAAATQTFTLTVNLPPQITSADYAALPAVGAAAAFTVTAEGQPTPVLSETGSLPPGITFTDNGDGTATLSGTPTISGKFAITIAASNGMPPNAIQAFTLEVKPYDATPRGRVAVSMVSVDSSDAPGGASSGNPKISSDGRYVLFYSSDLGLDPRFKPSTGPVLYVHDRVAGTTSLVSLGTDDLPVPGVINYGASISANGNAVAFHSVYGTTQQTVVRDLSSATSRLVPGAPQSGTLNLDGSVVAFPPNNNANTTTVFNLYTGQTRSIAHPFNLFSADGNYLIYSDGAVWEYNLTTGTTVPVSVDQSGIPRPGRVAAVSADGRWIAYTSNSHITSSDPSACAPINPNCGQIYRRDMLQTRSDLVDAPAQPPYAWCPTRGPFVISDDGQRLTFTSDCARLGEADTYDYQQTFLHDFRLGITFSAAVDTHDAPIVAGASGLTLSGDGGTVVYSTTEDVLDRGTTAAQVYTLPVANLEQEPTGISTSTSVMSSDSMPSVGETVTFTATIATNGVRPTGTVRFFFPYGEVACNRVELTSQAPYTASCSQVIPEPRCPCHAYGGDFTEDMWAIYSGDDDTGTSYNYARVQPKPASTSIQIQVNPNRPGVGDPITVTATLSEFGSAGTPEGEVKFTIDNTQDAGTVTVENGTATSNTISGLAQGMHTVRVSYLGDYVYTPMDSDFSFEVR